MMLTKSIASAALLFAAIGVTIASAQPSIDGFRLGMSWRAIWDVVPSSGWVFGGNQKRDEGSHVKTYTFLHPGDSIRPKSLEVSTFDGSVQVLTLTGQTYTRANIERLRPDVAGILRSIIQQVGKPTSGGLDLATVTDDSLLSVSYLTDATIAVWERRHWRASIELLPPTATEVYSGSLTPVVVIHRR